MRPAEHAPRDPFRLLERRHGLAEIVERGAVVLVERYRVIPSAEPTRAPTITMVPTDGCPPGEFNNLETPGELSCEPCNLLAGDCADCDDERTILWSGARVRVGCMNSSCRRSHDPLIYTSGARVFFGGRLASTIMSSS